MSDRFGQINEWSSGLEKKNVYLKKEEKERNQSNKNWKQNANN